METQFTLQPHENGRTRVVFEVTLSADEMSELERKKCARHVDSAKPVPCQFYQEADPMVRVVMGQPKVNSTPTKSYVLSGARSVTLNRPMPGKTLLRIMVPSQTDLGYINKVDEPALNRWWESTQAQLKQELGARLFATVIPTNAPKPMASVEIKTETKLNPLEPSEAGVRRRSLEDY
jgi:hypothetical protein